MRSSAFAVVLGLLAWCGPSPASAQLVQGPGQGLGAHPQAERRDHVNLVFTRLTSEIGLSSTFTQGNTQTGGVAWIDYNGDHLPDLFISNGSGLAHKLYRNNGDGSFSDVSGLVSKPDLALEDAGALFGDLDNDGDQDLLVYVDSPSYSPTLPNTEGGGPNLLYANQGGTFSELGRISGLVDPSGRRNTTGGLADYDRDGLLDVYLGHGQRNNPPAEGVTDFDRLLRGTGGGLFSDVTATTRIDGYGRDASASLWFDVDDDGRPDLYVGNAGSFDGLLSDMDSHDILYRQDPAVPWFRDATGDPHMLGDDSPEAHGMDVGDIDNDGDWDLYVTDKAGVGPLPDGNALYLGRQDGRLSDNVADLHGVVGVTSWACNFADFDHDGWTDLWVGTEGATVPELLYLNDRDGTFRSVAVAGFNGNDVRGGACADYDGDGDVDLCLWNQAGNTCIYRNDSFNTQHWIEFELTGSPGNRSAIGAVVYLETPGQPTQRRRVSGGDSSHSQQDHVLHFGLGHHVMAQASIDWLDGTHEELGAVAADRVHFALQGAGLQPEVLTDSTARWDQSAQTLTVSSVTTYGGRVTHQAVGYGPMPYLVTGLGYRAVFASVPANPGTVTVTSSSGASWVLTVLTVP